MAARILTLPATPGFRKSTFTLYRAVAASVSPFTGKYRTQEFDATYWLAELSLPPMKRAEVAAWQAFFLKCEGQKNHFKLGDPDAQTPLGTYNNTNLLSIKRTTVASGSIVVTASTGAFARTGIGTNNFAGSYIHVTGATNEDNNGTHKISSVTNANTVVVDTDYSTGLVNETFTGVVGQNVKGATALMLTKTGSGTGTIVAGDYLAILDGTAATNNPSQLVMAVENATVSGNYWSVETEPKLRADLANSYYVVHTAAKGLFRMASPMAEWDSNHVSTYGIAFSCVEVS